MYQGQKVRFTNPTVLQSDSNFHQTNRVGLSKLNCNYKIPPKISYINLNL